MIPRRIKVTPWNYSAPEIPTIVEYGEGEAGHRGWGGDEGCSTSVVHTLLPLSLAARGRFFRQACTLLTNAL